MKRMILAIGLVALALQSALAWRPAGWIFCREGASGLEYAYSQTENQWYYFNGQKDGGAWAHNLGTHTWWYLTTHSALRAGWSYWSWPHAYCAYNGAWYFIDVNTPHWVYKTPAGPWSRLGEEASAPTPQQHEARAHQLINSYRVSNGRSAMSYSSTIADIARVHSQNMANGSVAFGHDGFDARVNQIKNYMTITAWAENVAYNSDADPPYRAYIQWINSSGHNANILNATYNNTGIGAAKRADGAWFFTQIFVHQN